MKSNQWIVCIILSFFLITPSILQAAPPENPGPSANLAERIAVLEAALETANTAIANLQSDLAEVQNNSVLDLDGYLSFGLDASGYPRALFTGVNVQVVNGTSDTTIVNGLGNLILGYNNPREFPLPICSDGQYATLADCEAAGEIWAYSHKTGSHNIIGGDRNAYSSYGGIVVGENNAINQRFASVSGGQANTASNEFSSISGGSYNIANGRYGSISGGNHNTASGRHSSISGGGNNTTSVQFSSVSGGQGNVTSGLYSSISGGFTNTASDDYASVNGGRGNTADGYYSSVSGGFNNTASGDYSSISGGNEIENTVLYGWVGGGISSDLEPRVAAIEDNTVLDLDGLLFLDNTSGYATAQFSGVNVQVVNGTNDTKIVNGLGNLIVGYNNPRNTTPTVCSLGQYDNQTDCEAAGEIWAINHKTGSHNIVGGDDNSYSSFGGLVLGFENAINRAYASVSGGHSNVASGPYSSVSGGGFNTASEIDSSVSGGNGNTASANTSSVSGGWGNKATGLGSSVSGGFINEASNNFSSVSGGDHNNASGSRSSVLGGQNQTANTDYETIPAIP